MPSEAARRYAEKVIERLDAARQLDDLLAEAYDAGARNQRDAVARNDGFDFRNEAGDV